MSTKTAVSNGSEFIGVVGEYVDSALPKGRRGWELQEGTVGGVRDLGAFTTTVTGGRGDQYTVKIRPSLEARLPGYSIVTTFGELGKPAEAMVYRTTRVNPLKRLFMGGRTKDRLVEVVSAGDVRKLGHHATAALGALRANSSRR